MTTTQAPITERQHAFLTKLVSERPAWADVENIHPDTIERMSKRDASYWISAALNVPKEATPEAEKADTPEPPEMIHYLDGEVFKVVKARSTGRLYCKKAHLDEHGVHWVYIGKGPLARLSIDTVMSLEDMSELGAMFGFCLRCSAALTAPDSVFQGLGPVCVKRVREQFAELAKAGADEQLFQQTGIFAQ